MPRRLCPRRVASGEVARPSQFGVRVAGMSADLKSSKYRELLEDSALILDERQFEPVISSTTIR